MNNRIKELAAQAYKAERLEKTPTWKENEISNQLLTEFQVVFDKFAELIVQECVTMLDHNGNYLINDGATKQIKEHFGVE